MPITILTDKEIADWLKQIVDFAIKSNPILSDLIEIEVTRNKQLEYFVLRIHIRKYDKHCMYIFTDREIGHYHDQLTQVVWSKLKELIWNMIMPVRLEERQ